MPSIRKLIPLVGLTLAFFQAAIATPIPEPAVEAIDAAARRTTCTSTTKVPTSTVKPTTSVKVPTTTSVTVPTTTAKVPTTTTPVLPSTVINIPGPATPTLPVNGGATELAGPAAGLKLLHVAVGKGSQNYTCASVGAVPVSNGAVATLYDGTPLAFANIAQFHKASPACVDIAGSPPKGALNVPGVGIFPVLGTHFFTNVVPNVPTFDLSTAKQLLSATKLNAIDAPADAAKGPSGSGAVKWLQLGDSGLSKGSTAGYRVVTSGGNAPATCASTAEITVSYCAEYWFYGP